MAFLEDPHFCALDEYNSGLHKRIAALSLRSEDLYTMMFRLDDETRQAAKLAVKMLDIARSIGMTVVTFAVVDADLNQKYIATEQLTNDFVMGAKTIGVRDVESGHGYAVREAYFKDYFEDQFGEFLEAHNSTRL